MANHDVSNAEFNSELRRYETTDRGSASVFNENEKVLINNDVHLKNMIGNTASNLVNGKAIGSIKFKGIREDDTRVLGKYSSSFGIASIAQGDYSFAGGFGCETFCNYSFAFGRDSSTYSTLSLAFGEKTICASENSYILCDYDGQRKMTYITTNNKYPLKIGQAIIYHATLSNEEKTVVDFDEVSHTIIIDSPISQPDKFRKYDIVIVKSGQMEYNPSYAFGFDNKVLGKYSAVFGYSSLVLGPYSISSGEYNLVYGYHSSAFGKDLQAYDSSQMVIGKCNIEKDSHISNYVSFMESDLFVIGNGMDTGRRANAFRVTGAGATYGMSAFNSTGADYAEFFEWADGNPNNEDRVGHFVTFSDDKIKIANQNDDYILGVISGNPSVIGNSHNDMWNEMYVRDEFDRIVYEDVEVPDTFKTIYHDAVYENQNINPLDIDTNKESNILISEAYDEEVLDEPKHMEHRMKLNPKYNPSHEYIPREKRPEWSAVGMFGVLSVYDNGTCTVNGYAKVSNNGIATKSDSGYRVLKRLTNNIVKILFRS